MARFTTALYDLGLYPGLFRGDEGQNARQHRAVCLQYLSLFWGTDLGLFTEMLDKGQSVFINNANLIKKLSFPKICLPIIVTLSAVLNFAIIFSLFLIFIIVTGNFPGWLFFSVIPVLLLQILLPVGWV